MGGMGGMGRIGDNNYCVLNKLKQFRKKEGFYKQKSYCNK
jgi:hypothetical protein